MDLVSAVVLGNCALAIGCLLLRIAIVRCRRQLVAWTNWCDRTATDCSWLLADAPQSLSSARSQIRQLRQLYRQQGVTVDRLRTIGLAIGIVRSVLESPTFKFDRK
jgi:hypothetical protein